MPTTGASLTLTTTPQRIDRPSARAYAALGVANSGGQRVIVSIGAEQWPVAAGFQAVIPLPTTQQVITAYTASATSTVDLTWFMPADIDSVTGLKASLITAQTGSLVSSTALGTVDVNSIENPVSLDYSTSSPLPVEIVTTSDTAPAPDLEIGTVATANTYQLVASTGGVLLGAILSNTGADSLSWGLTTSDSAPTDPLFVQASGAAPIVFPAQLGLAGPLYLWVTSATAGAAFAALWAAS